MGLTFSDIASFAMVGSIAISTGGFIQSLDFVKNYTGHAQPFPMFLISGFMLLLTSGLLLVHRLALSEGKVSDHVKSVVEHAVSFIALGGIIVFVVATGFSMWLYLRPNGV